jgi:hypothetical protein
VTTLTAKNIPLDNVKEILSFNNQVLTKDNRIVGRLDKNMPIFTLLLQKPLIESSGGLYRHRGVTHMVQFPTGDQILFGHLTFNKDIWLEIRIRGPKYSRSHNPYISYMHLIK